MTCSVSDTRASLAGAHVGSSGWAYTSWRPGFYPAGTRPEDFLASYAARLPAVELNATGYRLASEEQFARWAAQVPDGFQFAVKAPPRALRALGTLEERVRALGDRLGCVRVVVEAPRDDGLLELLLGSADPSLRYALDLRDPSWDGVEPRLAEHGAVRVGDASGAAGWCYLRFRDPPYDEQALRAAAGQIDPLLAAGVDVFAFFRHEDEPTAPRHASRLLELLSS
jgi:uncharacterized protein YecE (DUF72 family)